MEWWDYAIIIGMGLIAIGVLIGIVIIIMKLGKPAKPALNNEDYLTIGKLTTKIEQIEANIPATVAASMNQAKADYLALQINAQKTMSDELRDHFKAISDNVASRLEAGFKTTTETFTEVNRQLGSIAETQKSLSSVSSEVNNLRRVLEGNQSRGQFGEHTLETIVKSVFGDEVRDIYAFQKPIDDPLAGNVKPDVTIFLPEPDKRLCIDSKFPFANYKDVFDASEVTKSQLTKFKSDLLKHVTKIHDDYIVPNVTASYALMFIPSDGIFAFVHVHLFDVVEAAYRADVIIVSPATLQPMLATVNLLRIDRQRADNVAELNRKIDALRVEFKKFDKAWGSFATNVRKTLDGIDEIERRNRVMIRLFESIKTIDTVEEADAMAPNIELDDLLP